MKKIKINKRIIIFLILIGFGILILIFCGNPIPMLFIGSTGKAIVGQYAFPAPEKQGKVIGGCYGECPSGADTKLKIMASSSATGGL